MAGQPFDKDYRYDLCMQSDISAEVKIRDGLYEKKHCPFGQKGTKMGQNEGKWGDFCDSRDRTKELSSCEHV